MCIMMRIFMMPKLRITTGKIQQGGINVWFHNQTCGFECINPVFFEDDFYFLFREDPNIIYKIETFVI